MRPSKQSVSSKLDTVSHQVRIDGHCRPAGTAWSDGLQIIIGASAGLMRGHRVGIDLGTAPTPSGKAGRGRGGNKQDRLTRAFVLVSWGGSYHTYGRHPIKPAMPPAAMPPLSLC